VQTAQAADHVMAVEPGGIEYIALDEQHGTPRQLFWTWNSPNWAFATMFLGVIPIVASAVVSGRRWSRSPANP
jgi:NCS1 family nucleobase:cation symporter-1